MSEAGQTCVGSAGFGPLSSGPQADFQREQPNQSVDAVFPAGPGYVVLSWDEAHTTLRASGLERSGTDGRWHELTANECPAPEPGKLSAARLGSGGGAGESRRGGRRAGGQPHRPPHLRRRAEPDPVGLSRPDLPLPAGGQPRAGEAGAAPARTGAGRLYRAFVVICEAAAEGANNVRAGLLTGPRVVIARPTVPAAPDAPPPGPPGP